MADVNHAVRKDQRLARPPRARHTDIHIVGSQLATISRAAFESIADDALYGDTRRRSNQPPLTLRAFLEGDGPQHAVRRRVRFPVGLVDRVRRMLEARGWRVVVRPEQRVEFFSPRHDVGDAGLGCPHALQRAYGRLYSLLYLPGSKDRVHVLTTLRQQFPDLHLLVLVKHMAAAKELSITLSKRMKVPVTCGNEPRYSDPWTHVDAIGTFTGRSVMDWAFVVVWDAALIISKTAIEQISYMFGSIRIGFLARDERNLQEADRAVVESMFGPVIYRSDDVIKYTAVSVAWLSAPASPASDPANELERKRYRLWQNDRRNRFLASVALAITAHDPRALEKLGLYDAAQWLASSHTPSPPSVAIAVENAEHGRELLKLLPGWNLALAPTPDDAPYLLDGNTIVTLSRALQSTVGVDVVLYGAGRGERWLEGLGTQLPFLSSDRLLVLDVADDCDPQTTRDVRLRATDYQRRGWTMLGMPYRDRQSQPGLV